MAQPDEINPNWGITPPPVYGPPAPAPPAWMPPWSPAPAPAPYVPPGGELMQPPTQPPGWSPEPGGGGGGGGSSFGGGSGYDALGYPIGAFPAYAQGPSAQWDNWQNNPFPYNPFATPSTSAAEPGSANNAGQPALYSPVYGPPAPAYNPQPAYGSWGRAPGSTGQSAYASSFTGSGTPTQADRQWGGLQDYNTPLRGRYEEDRWNAAYRVLNDNYRRQQAAATAGLGAPRVAMPTPATAPRTTAAAPVPAPYRGGGGGGYAAPAVNPNDPTTVFGDWMGKIVPGYDATQLENDYRTFQSVASGKLGRYLTAQELARLLGSYYLIALRLTAQGQTPTLSGLLNWAQRTFYTPPTVPGVSPLGMGEI